MASGRKKAEAFVTNWEEPMESFDRVIVYRT